MRLIDADALLENQYEMNVWNTATGDFGLPVVDAYDIMDAPTIGAILVKDVYALESRLKHLLKSDYIRRFDDKDPQSGEYKLDIRDADKPLPRWIPCSERMPEPDTYVLAVLRDGEMCTVRLYDDGCWIGCRGFAPSEAVTHWMPLPDPPKGDAING